MLDVETEIGRDLIDDLGSDAPRMTGISIDKCIFAQGVDQPRIAPRLPVQLENGVRWKHFIRIWAACQLQPTGHISRGLIQKQRFQLRAQSNSLLKLPQIDTVKLLVKFLLSHE